MTRLFALCTGGNRGIGFDVCKKLVAAGKPVILTARDPSSAEAAVKELAAAPGADVRWLQFDASDPASIDALVATVAKDYDAQIDLLINNAGMLVRNAWDKETFDATIATNYFAPVGLTRKLAQHLSDNALVVMVSSGLGGYDQLSSDYAEPIRAAKTLDELDALASFHADSGMPGHNGMYPTYSVSKCLLNRAVQLLHEQQLLGRRVDVASVCPGWCRTRMGTDAATRSSEQGADSVLWPYLHREDGDVGGAFFRDGARLEW